MHFSTRLLLGLAFGLSQAYFADGGVLSTTTDAVFNCSLAGYVAYIEKGVQVLNVTHSAISGMCDSVPEVLHSACIVALWTLLGASLSSVASAISAAVPEGILIAHKEIVFAKRVQEGVAQVSAYICYSEHLTESIRGSLVD